jgi:dihydrofolate reductase
MRKIVLSVHISLDGYISGPNGEMDWIRIDEEMFDFVKTLTDKADTAFYGRTTWEMMHNYWPTAADKPDASRHDREHSSWYMRVKKIVLSNSLKGAGIEGVEFISGDINAEVARLKSSGDKDIVIFGSPSLARILTGYNLIDEYWLFINPVILGKGKSIYPLLENRLGLSLISTRTFPCGVIALGYSLK